MTAVIKEGMVPKSTNLLLGGKSFNAASYTLLTIMVAQVTGLKLGDFMHMFGRAHIHHNHFGQAKLRRERQPKPRPFLRINLDATDIFGFKAPIAV
jgi:thymidylate synthase